MEPVSRMADFFVCIEAIDLKSDDVASLYAQIKELFRPLAEKLHVAKSISTLKIPPNPFEPEGYQHEFSTTYDECAASDDYSLTIDYNMVLEESGTAQFWPVAGYRWTKDEIREIKVMSKFVFALISRAYLVRVHNQFSFIDLMTGLLNTAGVRRFVGMACKKGTIKDYVVCFFNLRNFKYLNQRYGVKNGDHLLKEYGLALYRFVHRAYEAAARLGGDNFLVIIKKERLEDFFTYAQNITVEVTRKGKLCPVVLSSRFGIYECKEGDTGDNLIQNVSIAFRKAKEEKMDLVYFTEDMATRMMEGEKIVRDFPRAILAGEIVPFYQPKVEVASKKLYGAEALVRWIKNGSPISPGVFMPALEHDGSLHTMDIHILECVAKDIRCWLDMGIEPVRISVNFDKSDLMVPTIVQDTLEILKKYELSGKYIEIELTETSAYDNMDVLNKFIGQMHAEGIKIAMDDFGTGYSSLNFLKNADFNVVKLDKSFVDNIERHMKKDEVMLKSMVKMLRELDMEVVAEGVETQRQMEFVHDLKVGVIQGFYFDRPMPSAEFEERLKRRYYE